MCWKSETKNGTTNHSTETIQLVFYIDAAGDRIRDVVGVRATITEVVLYQAAAKWIG